MSDIRLWSSISTLSAVKVIFWLLRELSAEVHYNIFDMPHLQGQPDLWGGSTVLRLHAALGSRPTQIIVKRPASSQELLNFMEPSFEIEQLQEKKDDKRKS